VSKTDLEQNKQACIDPPRIMAPMLVEAWALAAIDQYLLPTPSKQQTSCTPLPIDRTDKWMDGHLRK